jgi:hypothetical protein
MVTEYRERYNVFNILHELHIVRGLICPILAASRFKVNVLEVLYAHAIRSI